MISSDERSPRWPEFCARAAALLVLVSLASLCLIGSDRLGVGKPLVEDAYYPLTVSRNLALGNGMSADGETLTNGVQPLFTLISAGSFLIAGGDRLMGLRLQLALHALLFAGAAALAAGIARQLAGARDNHGWGIAALIYAGAIFPLTIHFNGLETGFQIAMLLVCVMIHMRYGIDSTPAAARLGALLGLLVLARIDAVFLVILLSAYTLWRLRATPVKALIRSMAIGGTAFAVSLPWWVYNITVFGALTPSSGRALQDWGLEPERWIAALVATAQNVTPWLYSSWMIDGPLGIRLALSALGLVGLFMLWRIAAPDWLTRLGLPESPARDRFALFARLLLAHFAILVAWYASSSWALFFYPRYFAFLSVLPIILLAAIVIVHLKRLPRPLVMLGIAGLAIQGTGAAVIYHSGAWLDGNTAYAMVRLARDHAPKDEWIAAGQSGTLGFFRDKVVNLDGRINNTALAQRADIRSYLDNRGIDWVVDGDNYIILYLGRDPAANGWCEIARDGAFALYRRSPGPACG